MKMLFVIYRRIRNEWVTLICERCIRELET